MTFSTCPSGHMACEKCHTSDGCYHCGHATIRIRMFEDLVKELDFQYPCIHGCPIQDSREALARHEPQCEFRHVPCPHGSGHCKEKIQYRHLLKHIQKHPWIDNGETESGDCIVKFPISCSYYPPCPLSLWKYDGQHFICKVVRRPNCLLMWVYLIGSPDKAKDYKVTLVFKNGEKSTLYHQSRKCGVIPIDTRALRICSHVDFKKATMLLGTEAEENNTLELYPSQQVHCITTEGLTDEEKEKGWDKVIFCKYQISCL